MKILFISSGNSNTFDIAPFIKSQGESLRQLGVYIDYFTVNDKGLLGYLKCAHKLRKYIKNNPVDIIHAHYTLSGWVAVLSFSKKPIILSLMGTDAYGEYIGINRIRFSSRYLTILTYLIQPFMNSIICKSINIEQFVFQKKKTYVIPNGVSLDKVKYQKNGFRSILGLKPNLRYVLFLGDKNNLRKNFSLIEKAFRYIDSNNISLITPHPVPHDDVIKYLNSIDVLVSASFMEGSPNLVKEAMACNCPVVATDVGDISWLFGNEPGYFISRFDPYDMAEKIKAALEFTEKFGRTNGRERIIKLGLDSDTVATKIIDVYKKAYVK